VKFYWIGNGRVGNFGDVLTPYILDYFNISYSYTNKHHSNFDAICVGSIARYAKENTVVLGSGFLSRKNNVPYNADYRFVRGPHTRAMILKAGGSCPEIYGDPGLLLSLISSESQKEYDLGIIPHASHYEKIKNLYPNEFVINLTTNNALKTAKEISKCRNIISSSLHGIIAAHSFNIPAAWVKFEGIKGDDIKFEDYFAAIKKDPIISTYNDPIFINSGKIDLTPIIDIFKDLKNEY
jgi:hypothetical protein